MKDEVKSLNYEEIRNILLELQKKLDGITVQNTVSLSELSIKEKSERNQIVEDMRRRLELTRKIKLFQSILNQRIYQNGTNEYSEELINQNAYSGFSWGLDENEQGYRPIILDLTQENGERTQVVDYGEFRYLLGQDGVSVEDMPDYSEGVECKDKATFDDFMKEQLKLIRVTKTLGNNVEDYFILSSISKQQIDNPELRDFFVNTFCSRFYLDTVVNGSNGIYAGKVLEDKEGTPIIKFDKKSVHAAMLAEGVQGNTQLLVTMHDKDIRKLPGKKESLQGIIYRFKKELLKERQDEQWEK